MEFVLTHPDSGLKQILVLFDGVPYEADSDHPWWDEIVRLCLADDARVLDLFPIRSVQQASEEVPFEGEPEQPRWLPHNVEVDDDEEDEETEARADAREGEYTAHEIIEEGS